MGRFDSAYIWVLLHYIMYAVSDLGGNLRGTICPSQQFSWGCIPGLRGTYWFLLVYM